MGKVRTLYACTSCGQQVAQWVGRCPGCGGWGTIADLPPSGGPGSSRVPVATLSLERGQQPERAPTGFPGFDRVLGGGIVPGSVALLAGEPGIGKSTLLLQLVAHLSDAGFSCLFASGEESRDQVASRAARIGVDASEVLFVPGRELPEVLQAARDARPALLVVDSIQSLRDPSGTQLPGGPSQVRGCTDALVGLAKAEGIAVLMAGHVTKDGDLAGPRTLEHAVDTVLTFDGDPRSGLRMLAGGKNRFGQEGEVAWFEMRATGLDEIDPAELLRSGTEQPGAATALPLAGRRALAVEVQALVAPTEGGSRRQATGLDGRRFQLVAAVLDREFPIGLGRAELYGASLGGVRIDDPACDLAVAVALASAATGTAPPAGSAFVGEVGLTGQVRPAPGLSQRLAAARAAGCATVYAAGGSEPLEGLRVIPVTRLLDALSWVGSGEDSDRGSRRSIRPSHPG
ncbi:MAG: AAA family ATPase [Actinomycetota bacterium]